MIFDQHGSCEVEKNATGSFHWVGISEHMEWSLILLELALPYFFKGVLSQYNGSGAVRDALIQTQATYKKPLSDDVVQYKIFAIKAIRLLYTKNSYNLKFLIFHKDH